ncbi:MAG: glycosyltransferase family 4 protein, partial [bacterium]
MVEREGIDLIETQDYEAPLYYFQLRRALRLGPKKTPPCLVHLHSPTEFIVRYNEWDIAQPYYATAKQLEDYSIAAAEARLCPSHYLARQAEKHYGLADGSVQVIPYPMNDLPVLERGRES